MLNTQHFDPASYYDGRLEVNVIMEEKKSNLSPTAQRVLALVKEISEMEATLKKKKFELVKMAEGKPVDFGNV